MQHKRIAAVTGAALLTLAVGCGGGDGDSKNPDSANDSAPPPAAAKMDPKVVDDSIVFLQIQTTGYVQYPTKTGGTAWSDAYTFNGGCTGWFAGTGGEIVTAGHCVDDTAVREKIIKAFLRDEQAENLTSDAISNWKVEGQQAGSPMETILTVKQPNYDGAVIHDWTPVQLVDRVGFTDGDMCLLRVNGLSDNPPPMEVAADDPEVGASVTSVGFPGSVENVSNDMMIPNPSFKSGTISSQQVSPRGVSGYEMNADLSPGMSGGPTVNEAGEVLGINSYQIRGEEQAFNFITNTADLRRFLEKNGVDN